MTRKRAQEYAKKIIGTKGDKVLYTKEAVGLSFHWMELAGKPTKEDIRPPRLPNVIHIWEDANGVVIKTFVGTSQISDFPEGV